MLNLSLHAVNLILLEDAVLHAVACLKRWRLKNVKRAVYVLGNIAANSCTRREVGASLVDAAFICPERNVESTESIVQFSHCASFQIDINALLFAKAVQQSDPK